MLDNEAPTEVVSHCRYILQHFPKNVAVYRLLGQALLQKGQNEVQPQLFDEAAEIFRRVLSAQPDDYVAHLGLGEIAQQREALDEALWHFERASEQTPGNSVLKDTIRQLYEKRGVHGAVDEKLPLTRVTLVRQYLKADAYDQALNEIRDVLEVTPERLDLHMLEAEALWRSGRWVEAGEAAAYVLRECPDCVSANRIMASLWIKYRRPTDAQPFLARLEALDPAVAARVLKADGEGADAIALPRLDYTSKAAASLTAEMPEWVQDLDEADQYANPFEAPVPDIVPDSGPAFHEQPPSAGLPDWAAVFAGMGDEPERDDWAQAQATDRPQEDSDPGLSGDVWDEPYAPAQTSGPAPLPDVPDWFAESLNVQGNAPAPDFSDQDDWTSVERQPQIDYGDAEPDSGSEEMPEFDSFLQNIAASRGGTGELTPSTEFDVLDEPIAPLGEPGSGYALDWMNELESPETAEAVPGLDLFGSAPPEQDAAVVEATDPAIEEWLTSQGLVEAEAEEEGEEEPEAELSDEDWIAVMASRSPSVAADEGDTRESDEDAALSDEDWLARLSTGSLDSETQPEAPDQPEPEIGDVLERMSEDAGLAEIEDGESGSRPTITDDELEMLRRASRPPKDLDLDTLFGATDADAEAVPAEEIPSWLQSLGPGEEAPAADEPEDSSDTWDPSSSAEFAAMLDNAAVELSPEEIETAFEPEAQGEIAPSLFEDLAEIAPEATEAESDDDSDLIKALGLSSAALPGTVELDAELLAFFDTPEDSMPYAGEPEGTAAESPVEDSSWVDAPAVSDDWLGAYVTPAADAPSLDEPESTVSAEAGSVGWLPAEREALPEVDEQEAALVPLPDEADAAEDMREAEMPALADEAVAALELEDGSSSDETEVVAEAGEGMPAAEESGAPGWLTDIASNAEESPLFSGLDALLTEAYDPFEGGREDQVPTYAATKETGILQPNEQPDWMTAFLGSDEEVEAPAPDALPVDLDEADPDQPLTHRAIQGTGVIMPESEADWLASLDDDRPSEVKVPETLDTFAEDTSAAMLDETEALNAVPDDSEVEPGIYVPLPSRQTKLNYMPDWLAAIASEGKKLDAELFQAVESEPTPEDGLAPELGAPGVPDTPDDAMFGLDEDITWLNDDEADLDTPDQSAAAAPAAPNKLDITEDDLYGLTEGAWQAEQDDDHQPAEPMAAMPVAPEELEDFGLPTEADAEDGAHDLAFLEQLDQVDWLPDVQETPAGDQNFEEDDFLADLDLQGVGESDAATRGAEPGVEVAPAWDLPDTTSDIPAQADNYVPPDNFAFDDELPAWNRGQGGHGQDSNPVRGLPEWLRPPDED